MPRSSSVAQTWNVLQEPAFGVGGGIAPAQPYAVDGALDQGVNPWSHQPEREHKKRQNRGAPFRADPPAAALREPRRQHDLAGQEEGSALHQQVEEDQPLAIVQAHAEKRQEQIVGQQVQENAGVNQPDGGGQQQQQEQSADPIVVRAGRGGHAMARGDFDGYTQNADGADHHGWSLAQPVARQPRQHEQPSFLQSLGGREQDGCRVDSGQGVSPATAVRHVDFDHQVQHERRQQAGSQMARRAQPLEPLGIQPLDHRRLEREVEHEGRGAGQREQGEDGGPPLVRLGRPVPQPLGPVRDRQNREGQRSEGENRQRGQVEQVVGGHGSVQERVMATSPSPCRLLP